MTPNNQDETELQALGYRQELNRRMGGFSNFAVSLSIICILAGGITSFSLGLCGVGGAAIGLGWPLVSLFALCVAACMGHLASAYPTAGGLYHWASILGGRGWGWATAWFNLLGLITVLAAINVGTVEFSISLFHDWLPPDWQDAEKLPAWLKPAVLLFMAISQALFNHRGIHLTTRLTDASGYLILVLASSLTLSLLFSAPTLDWERLITFSNFSGAAGKDVWPATESLIWLFALSFLLPAYTITGFDASAHTAEETVQAGVAVPRGIVRSVLVSGLFGWAMLCSLVLAPSSLPAAAAEGSNAVVFIIEGALPHWLVMLLGIGIVFVQYLCGLATVTSASRMLFAFARDGGLPGSSWLRLVHSKHLTPAPAIWVASLLAWGFTLYSSIYLVISAVCTVLLYVSYVLPTSIALVAYLRGWRIAGPWSLGKAFPFIAASSIAGCLGLLVIGSAAKDFEAGRVLGIFAVCLAVLWFAFERRRFVGPPVINR